MNDTYDMQDKLIGLTSEEVMIRNKQGLKNTGEQSITKTKGKIIKENTCTLFNLLNGLIALALLFVGAWTNLVFLVIIIANILIGIYQELHAKKLVDELSLLMVPAVKVLRDAKEQEVSIEDLVLDDLMILESGVQICCDSVVVYGDVEVNESLLTGESDAVHKKINSELLSGSSIISGKCYAKVICVGNDNYASKIANEAKQLRDINSELLNSMKKVTKITSYMIIPLGIILFLEAYVLRGSAMDAAVISSSAGLLGMLPKGLVLLISVSLAAGVAKLAKQKILIQDLYSLESLAHVDTLCLDKTGTITNGLMKVEHVYKLDEHTSDADEYIGSFLSFSDDNNTTNQALCEHFELNKKHHPVHKIPFSSVRKWSAVQFDNNQTYIIGAPEKLMKTIPYHMAQNIKEGKRIIVIGRTKDTIYKDQLLPAIQPLYALVLTDTIRDNVQETLAYFKTEGVDIKVISGDHVDAVSAIAHKAGLVNYNACIDMSQVEEDSVLFDSIVNEYSVFGRVTPKQKKLLVQALQRQGHKVAMTGDGVNDILALKEADCGIAIAQGSDAVKQIAQVVLLNSDFSALPHVVLEGRRVVNNMTRVSGVFFIKTIYSIVLSLLCAIGNFPFPFIPIQITLIDAAVEAFPAFLTLLEPNTKPITGKFLPSVFAKSIPNSLAVIFCIVSILYMSNTFAIQRQEAITMMYICVALISMQAVIKSCLPLNTLRAFVCTCMVIGFTMAVVLFHQILEISFIQYRLCILTLIIVLAGFIVERMAHLLMATQFVRKKVFRISKHTV